VVTPTALELLGLHFRYDSSRAREELGWRPRPLDEVLLETATWLRRISWL
jgi:dihydroflavonol-4-reductase